jgi:hypothetical protein
LARWERDGYPPAGTRVGWERAGVSPCRNPWGRGGTGAPPPEPASNRSARALASPAHKFRWGDTRPSPLIRKLSPTPPRFPLVRTALLAAGCILLLAAGCGESGGVASGATASVYAAAPLCAEAERELARDGGQAGDIRVRVSCLPNVESDSKLDLATIGANARRATEDSTTVGYIGEPTRAATRFSEPILESAGVAQLSESSGVTAMRKLLRAVDEAGNSGSLRESVRDELE